MTVKVFYENKIDLTKGFSQKFEDVDRIEGREKVDFSGLYDRDED